MVDRDPVREAHGRVVYHRSGVACRTSTTTCTRDDAIRYRTQPQRLPVSAVTLLRADRRVLDHDVVLLAGAEILVERDRAARDDDIAGRHGAIRKGHGQVVAPGPPVPSWMWIARRPAHVVSRCVRHLARTGTSICPARSDACDRLYDPEKSRVHLADGRHSRSCAGATS